MEAFWPPFRLQGEGFSRPSLEAHPLGNNPAVNPFGQMVPGPQGLNFPAGTTVLSERISPASPTPRPSPAQAQPKLGNPPSANAAQQRATTTRTRLAVPAAGRPGFHRPGNKGTRPKRPQVLPVPTWKKVKRNR